MQKIKIGGKLFACLNCGCKNRWEDSTRPKGYVCGNCDAFMSKELLDYMVQNQKMWPTDEEVNFKSGGFAPTPPEYGKGEV